MQKKLLYILPIILLLISSSTVTAASTSQQALEQVEIQQQKIAHYYDLGDDLTIAIFYNEHYPLGNATADSIYGSLRYLTPNVVLVNIETELEYISALKTSFDLVIHVFDSDYLGMMMKTQTQSLDKIEWPEVARLLQVHGVGSHHIFAMGNTAQLLFHTGMLTNVVGSSQQVIDAQHSFIFAMWEISEFLQDHPKASNLAEDVQLATLDYFANNFNALVSQNLEPDNPMGIEDPAAKQARVDNFYEKHPARYERVPQPGNYLDEITGRERNGQTGEMVIYPMDIYSSEELETNLELDELTASNFIISFLPEDSGLRGPIGGIVDELLGFLLEEIGDLIGLSGETLEALANALFAIPDFIGAIADPSASKIKGFLDNLKPMIPIPEDKLEYFDLIVDALFLLRGDADDIENFITSAISKVVPDLGGGEDLVSLLTGIFNLGTGVFDSLQAGDKFIDVVFSVMNEQIVTDLLEKYLNNVTLFGASISDVIGPTVATMQGIINAVATGDFIPLVNDYLPLMMDAFPAIDGLLGEEGAKVLGLLASVLFIATGDFSGDTIADLLEILVGEFFPSLNTNQIRQAVEGIMAKINDVLKNPVSITVLKNDIAAILEAAGVNSGTFSNAIDAVEDLIAIIISLKDDGFTLDGATSLSSTITSILGQFNVISNDQVNTVNQVIQGLMAVIGVIKDSDSIQDLVSEVFSNSDLQTTLQELITFFVNTIGGGLLVAPGTALELNLLPDDANEMISQISEAITIVIDVIKQSGDNSVEGILMALLQGGAYVVTQLTGVDIMAYVEIAKNIFGTVLGYFDNPPSLAQILSDIQGYIPAEHQETAEKIADFLLGIQSIFTGGFKAVFAKLAEWLAGQVTKLIESVTGEFTSILDQEEWPLLEINIPVGIGDFSLFDINIGLGLKPGFGFNEETFYGMIFDLVFKGVSIFSGGASAADVLKTALSFLDIHPIFIAQLELDGFGSGESSFIDFMLSALGLELSFSGYGFFELSLFSFKNGVFNFDDFFKVIAWGFGFTLTLSRTFTLLDFLTGGAGGSLNSIGKYIGLDAISITIGFTIGLDVVKRAATANAPETGSLTVTLTIFFTVSLGINILIAKLILTGTLEITLTLLQDLVEPTPLRVFISVKLIITVTIGFLFWDWDFNFCWSPNGFSPEDPYELTPGTQEDAKNSGALGADFDNDGLSNEYEESTPGLNPNSEDSDGDGLSDKFETQTLKTDPGLRDTDADGLDDNIEIDIGTNPLAVDSDYDRLTDYEEAIQLGTNPMEMDTDGDLLDDYYEVNHDYNMTDIWVTAPSVTYFGVTYNTRTDVLNPDSDFDGLIDGNEGENGVYYGPELADNSEEVSYTPDPPLIFNGGYTHPLSNDTDKDSYEQDYAGDITPRWKFLRDMSDFTEIHGIPAIMIDPETGEPLPEKIFYTNPVNPDSDGDTGVSVEQRENPPFGFFLNSDGYELALDPPSDPLDGDTDDDGLIDGLEGILRPDANHTDVNNPDTDGDGLNDMVELELGTSARLVDSDYDGVTDADEFFVFGTNPFLYDTDGDGLSDGEELWTYHSNPHHRDTDLDGIPDYKEVWVYFSDPADEDSDNDGLTDWEEIYIHYTDPFTVDTDGDGLFDGDEILGLNYTYVFNGTEYWVLVFTDPLKWDTDNDSLLTLDQDGEISQSMSDGDEWAIGTRPDRVDTDGDGLSDAWELWLGKGKIPNLDPIPLDPLNKDTDNDTLFDGQEISVANVSTLLYPYIGFVLTTPYNTSAVSNDTDGDFIPDAEELVLGTLPYNSDSDNDTLTDYEELFITGTNPAKNDTDGDTILDPVEIDGYFFPEGHPLYDANATTVFTSPTELDSDGDLLPDGAEMFIYGKDPRNPHDDDPEILSGMLLDSDGDGLMDGEEYFVYQTTLAGEGGGPFQPDSDRDGLFDGLEVYETLTEPDNWDSDNDTYSDGLEVACGTNPNDNETTLDDFQACFDELSRLVVLSPANFKTYSTNAIPVIVYDPDDEITAVEFDYKYGDNLTLTSTTVDLIEDVDRGGGYWKTQEGFSFTLTNGTYEVEIRALRSDGDVVTRTVSFTIFSNPDQLEIVTPKDGFDYQFSVINQTSIEIPIEVLAGESYNSTWFTIYDANGTILPGASNVSLTKEPGRGSYYLPAFEFPNIDGTAAYSMIVYAQQPNGQVVSVSSFFTIRTPSTLETVATIAAPIAGVAVVTTVIRRAGFKNPFKKGGN
ncbi:MAG: hypothetical protein ACXAE3_05010 [Candidatus Kariarchaeaceae archaeon]|jgi:hypothetical protein